MDGRLEFGHLHSPLIPHLASLNRISVTLEALVATSFDANLYGVAVRFNKVTIFLIRMICRRPLKLKLSGLADCIFCTSCQSRDRRFR